MFLDVSLLLILIIKYFIVLTKYLYIINLTT